jgi:hypothetical protein
MFERFIDAGLQLIRKGGIRVSLINGTPIKTKDIKLSE